MITDIAIVGFIGMILQMLVKARAVQQKARISNIQFKFWEYFIEDWISHLISIGGVILYVYLIRNRVYAMDTETSHSFYELILGTSATVGYSGADIVSRFFGAASKRINAAIDHKTNIADSASGTLDKPTPATKQDE
jgi:hypothetical protein